jgi:hypothetical protein
MLDDFEVAQEARPARLALIDAAVEAAELSRRREGAWVVGRRPPVRRAHFRRLGQRPPVAS